MEILPILTNFNYSIIEEENTIERQKAGLLFNYNTQQFIKDGGGKFVKMNHLDSIRDWIERNTRTLIDTFRSLTEYNAKFGTEYEKYIGKDFDPAYIIIVFAKECRRAFELHPEIVTITDVTVDIKEVQAIVSYTANLINGTDFSGEITVLTK